jgi:hypothetical protein
MCSGCCLWLWLWLRCCRSSCWGALGSKNQTVNRQLSLMVCSGHRPCFAASCLHQVPCEITHKWNEACREIVMLIKSCMHKIPTQHVPSRQPRPSLTPNAPPPPKEGWGEWPRATRTVVRGFAQYVCSRVPPLEGGGGQLNTKQLGCLGCRWHAVQAIDTPFKLGQPYPVTNQPTNPPTQKPPDPRQRFWRRASCAPLRESRAPCRRRSIRSPSRRGSGGGLHCLAPPVRAH